jgi:hypothetical protein
MVVVLECKRVHTRINAQTLAHRDALPTHFCLPRRLLPHIIFRQFFFNIILEIVVIIFIPREQIPLRLLRFSLDFWFRSLMHGLLRARHLKSVSLLLVHIVEKRLRLVDLLLHCLRIDAFVLLTEVGIQGRHARSFNFLRAGRLSIRYITSHEAFN